MKTNSYHFGATPRALAAALIAAVALSAASLAHAGGTIKIDDTKWVSVGAGARLSFSAVEDAAPSGANYSKDFSVDSVRLYVNGQIHEYVKFEFNTELTVAPPAAGADPTATLSLLDAVAKLEFNDYFNVWFGRLLPPSDRFNLDGPYYLNVYDFPVESQRYPAVFAGRDNGVALWGQIEGGMFKWQFGAFQGRQGKINNVATSNASDNLLYAGRLTLNLMDPEPGYYNSSTYYGKKDILAIGVVGFVQADGAGDPAGTLGPVVPADTFLAGNVDLLFEKNLEGLGVVTLEGAYFNYDLGDASGDPNLSEGQTLLVSGLFLFGEEIGPGKVQPFFRFQIFDPDDGAGVKRNHKRVDTGVNYVIDGHNARLTLQYTWNDDPDGVDGGAANVNSVKAGLQLQI